MLNLKKKSLIAYHIAEGGFLLALGIYLLLMLQQTTTFYLKLPEKEIKTVLVYAIAALTVFKLSLLVFLDTEHRALVMRVIALGAVTALVYWLVFHRSQFMFILFLGLLTLGSIGSDYERVIRIYVVLAAVVVITAVIAALGGGISNLVSFDSGEIRSAWGICYPTNFASYLVYICILFWIGWKKLPDYVFLLPGILSFAAAFFIAHSRTSSICSLLFVVMVLFHFITDFYKDKAGALRGIRRIANLICILAFPLFSVLSIGLTFAYERGYSFAVKANELLSSRLSLTASAFKNYEVSLLGTPFEQIGQGFSTFKDANYNFIDSSYPLILLRYGVLLFCIIGFLWILMTGRAIKMNDRRLAYGMTLVAFHSAVEQHFSEIHYNILLILPIAVIYASLKKREDISVSEAAAGRGKKASKCTFAALTIVMALLGGAILLKGPSFLSVMRTICDITGIGDHNEGRRVLFSILAAAVVLFTGFALALYLEIRSLLTRARVYAAPLIYIVCIMIGCAAVVREWERTIDQAMPQYEKIITDDKSAVEAILAAEGARLYVTEVPTLYGRTYGNISRSFLSGEELAVYDDATVITDLKTEYNCFFRKGFLFAKISKKHAVYTNNRTVASNLQSAGFHVTGYYSKRKKVSLAKLAKKNGLSLSESGALILQGEEKSIQKGLGLDLRAGVYTTAYELSIPEDSYDADVDGDYIVCILQTCTDEGSNVVKEMPVYRSFFDQTGGYTAEVKCSLRDSMGVVFLARAEENQTVFIHSITYRKTPDYDTHTFFNKEGRKVREEYYDLYGNQITRDQGFFACEYAYDERGNVSTLRYYDNKNEPVMTEDGYFMCRRAYDGRNRKIREDYYDTKEDPVLRKGGYAGIAWEYDEQGNAIVQTYYDEAGNLACNSSGYARIEKEYDQAGRVTRQICFLETGEVFTFSQGYSIIEYEYDDNGNRIYEWYYDQDGNAVLRKEGYHGLHNIYDAGKRIIRQEYLGIDKRLTDMPLGYAQMGMEYNDRGLVRKRVYYNQNNDIITIQSGYAIVTLAYDEAGNIITHRFYDPDGEPVCCTNGYFVLQRSFTSFRRILTEEYFGISGERVLCSKGYCRLVNRYDEENNLLETDYYDLEGKQLVL